jgi:hypothetical protein
MPCLFESSLLAVIFLTLFLNIFTQIITEGHVSRVLFGHQATLLPKWDEDFSIALLRVGTVSLEASCVLGLGHEVGGESFRGSFRLSGCRGIRQTPSFQEGFL